MSIYTISGELVITEAVDANGWILWDGRNRFGVPTSAGIYYYIVKLGDDALLEGKFLLIRN